MQLINQSLMHLMKLVSGNTFNAELLIAWKIGRFYVPSCRRHNQAWRHRRHSAEGALSSGLFSIALIGLAKLIPKIFRMSVYVGVICLWT